MPRFNYKTCTLASLGRRGISANLPLDEFHALERAACQYPGGKTAVQREALNIRCNIGAFMLAIEDKADDEGWAIGVVVYDALEHYFAEREAGSRRLRAD